MRSVLFFWAWRNFSLAGRHTLVFIIWGFFTTIRIKYVEPRLDYLHLPWWNIYVTTLINRPRAIWHPGRTVGLFSRNSRLKNGVHCQQYSVKIPWFSSEFTGKLWFIQRINFSQTQQFITQNILTATCFDSIESSSDLPKNRSNVSKFIVHSGIRNAYHM
jgi:hypothetical protein